MQLRTCILKAHIIRSSKTIQLISYLFFITPCMQPRNCSIYPKSLSQRQKKTTPKPYCTCNGSSGAGCWHTHAAGGHAVKRINPLQKTKWVGFLDTEQPAKVWLLGGWCIVSHRSLPAPSRRFWGYAAPRDYFFLFNLKCVITPYFLPPVLLINFCRAPFSALISSKLSSYPSPWSYLLP